MRNHHVIPLISNVVVVDQYSRKFRDYLPSKFLLSATPSRIGLEVDAVTFSHLKFEFGIDPRMFLLTSSVFVICWLHLKGTVHLERERGEHINNYRLMNDD